MGAEAMDVLVKLKPTAAGDQTYPTVVYKNGQFVKSENKRFSQSWVCSVQVDTSDTDTPSYRSATANEWKEMPSGKKIVVKYSRTNDDFYVTILKSSVTDRGITRKLSRRHSSRQAFTPLPGLSEVP